MINTEQFCALVRVLMCVANRMLNTHTLNAELCWNRFSSSRCTHISPLTFCKTIWHKIKSFYIYIYILWMCNMLDELWPPWNNMEVNVDYSTWQLSSAYHQRDFWVWSSANHSSSRSLQFGRFWVSFWTVGAGGAWFVCDLISYNNS